MDGPLQGILSFIYTSLSIIQASTGTGKTLGNESEARYTHINIVPLTNVCRGRFTMTMPLQPMIAPASK